jgi:hypothetical protein
VSRQPSVRAEGSFSLLCMLLSCRCRATVLLQREARARTGQRQGVILIVCLLPCVNDHSSDIGVLGIASKICITVLPINEKIGHRNRTKVELIAI